MAMASAADRLMQHIRALVDPGPTSETDGQLLGRWADQRDGRAFAGLVGRHGALVWRVAWNVLRQREDAEDAFQATFLILARKAATLQRHVSIAGWLYQTAHRLALKARTATTRRLRREERAARKPVPQPLEELSVREARTILDEELERLGTVYREPLLLCLYEGATQDEAAKRLGCSLKTLKRRLERGRGLLGRRLARRGLAPATALAVTLCSRSEIPAQLMQQTTAAAAQFAAGEALTGTAAVLAQGVLRGLMLKKLGVYLAIFVAIGGMTLAAQFTLSREKTTLVTKSRRTPPREVAVPSDADALLARLDPGGDALPPGAVNRIGSTRFRQGSYVGRLQYAPDGNSIAAAANGYVYLWDAATGNARWRFPMNRNKYVTPFELAFSADGKKLAVLNATEYLVLAADSGKKLVRHEVPPDTGSAGAIDLAIAPDLGSFALGCEDATVRIHDAARGQEKLRLDVGDKAQRQLPQVIAFSLDARTITVIANKKSEATTFDTKTGKIVETREFTFDLTTPYLQCLSHDGQLLASVKRGRVALNDLKNRQAKNLFEEKDSGLPVRGCAAFSHDDSQLAVGGIGAPGMSPNIVLFDTATGKERLRLHGNATSLTFAPGGKSLASADSEGCITLWDLDTGKPLPTAPELKSLRSIRFAAAGKQILSFGDSLGWWEATSGKLVHRLAWGQNWHINYLPAISADGKLLATSLADGNLVLVDAVTGKQIRAMTDWKLNSVSYSSGILEKVNTAFSPDAAKLYFLTGSGGSQFNRPGVRVLILDVVTGQTLGELPVNSQFVQDIAVSPNGRWLASAGMDQEAESIFGKSGKKKQPGGKNKLPSGISVREYYIQLWDLTTGKLVHRLNPGNDRVLSMVFSADSSRLVSVSSDSRNAKPTEVKLWDVMTGNEARSFSGHQGDVLSVALTPDDRMLATGSADKTLRLWEVATGTERARIAGHEAPVFSLDFSPEGNLLAAASNDAPVYIWDVYGMSSLKVAGGKLAKEDREKLWKSLANPDARVGFQAVRELIARPSEATALLEESWRRLPRATSKQVRKWLDDLYSDQLALIATALEELEKYASGHEDLLRETLKQAGAVEMRRRLEKLMDRVNPEGLRRSRMLEVLEQLRTAPARQFLQVLAEQPEDATMAREAAAGLKRLGGGK
jgi:RNA polymerase sigma factor (sigma-70 family)